MTGEEGKKRKKKKILITTTHLGYWWTDPPVPKINTILLSRNLKSSTKLRVSIINSFASQQQKAKRFLPFLTTECGWNRIIDFLWPKAYVAFYYLTVCSFPFVSRERRIRAYMCDKTAVVWKVKRVVAKATGNNFPYFFLSFFWGTSAACTATIITLNSDNCTTIPFDKSTN